MERGVYFDGWFPRHHNYHPSHPARRLRMVDDLADYRATMLVWAALGAGSLSLPYLEQEATQDISARFRFYGFLNDSEFIAECQRRGIKVFGIVYDIQGWEFPVELNEEEDRILSLNEPRGVGKRGWIGLREFSQNRYPKLWPPFEKYFPGGLVNSDGERVTDLLEEACSRDIHGAPIHADWVESPDREHYAYQMDRNNPVWREYLKAVIRIQIDARVDGILFDSPDLPIVSVWYGGCFCKDCMKGFRSYLLESPDGRRELSGVELETFHYGQWLLERGYDFKVDRESTPLFLEYMRFQRKAVADYFAELADSARDYAASKGRDVLVSGNFYEFFPHFYAIQPKVDVLVTERKTSYRQSAWCRYAAAFGGDKSVVIIEDPYDSVIPGLVEKLRRGRGYDLFRLTMYEPAALGINMSVPYGAWLGSVIEDAFYAPHDLCVEIQGFLADNEHLYGPNTYSERAVAFSVGSVLRQPVVNRFQPHERGSGGSRTPFWAVCERLSLAGQPYDVIMFPDGELRADVVTAKHLARYRTLILPDCRALTRAQADALTGYLDGGGWIVWLSSLGANLDDEAQRAIVEHERTIRVEDAQRFEPERLPLGVQVSFDAPVDLMVNVVRLEKGAAIHLIRYDYDEALDRIPVLPSLEMRVRLPRPFFGVTPLSPGGELEASMKTAGGEHRLRLRNVPLYSVLWLR